MKSAMELLLEARENYMIKGGSIKNVTASANASMLLKAGAQLHANGAMGYCVEELLEPRWLGFDLIADQSVPNGEWKIEQK